MITKKQVGLLSAAFATAMCGNAFAATSTANLAVSASIASECSIEAAPTLGFGAYSPVGANSGANALNGSGNLSVTCTTGSTAPTIALNDGANPGTGSSGVVPVRQMANGAARLGYFLYQEAGRTTVWGDGVTSKAVTTPDGLAHTETIYGKVPGGQNQPVGAYMDTVVVTVTF
jgi:spore coat protein U-like protein